MYQEIWEAAVGEVLECDREPRNCTDRHAVAVLKDSVIIGHMPRTISRICSLFLRRGGTIHCSSDSFPAISIDVTKLTVYRNLFVACIIRYPKNSQDKFS